MEVALVEKYITEALKDKFGCEFEACGAFRHFKFTSTNFDFSFPASLTNEQGKSLLIKKINRWLSRDEALLQPNSHLVYNSDGVIQPSSVIGGESYPHADMG